MNPAVQPGPVQTAAVHQSTPSFLIENHDEAYYLWRDTGIKRATLVHVDAHHDMWPTNGGPITVGSFIYRAMMEEIVGDIYWVVPDDSFASAKNIDLLLRNIEILPNLRELRVSGNRLTATYEGHRLVVCAAKDMPALSGEVLVDVDVDYFVLPIVNAPETAEVPERTPWAWPQGLTEYLANIAPKMITVAYSVNGGTTPIRWKYLGDELLARLTDSQERMRYFELLREAAQSSQRREEILREAVRLGPGYPAAHWHLAELFENAGLLAEAQQCYRQAIAGDESYDSVYASAGPCLEAAGRVQDAAAEYKRLLRLDQNDRYALFGSGSIAATKHDWAAAQKALKDAISNKCDLPDAQRLLGDAYAAVGERQEALIAYEGYCAALSRGERSLGTPIASRQPVEDFYEIRIRSRMAKLYGELRNAGRAEEEYGWLSTKLVPNTPVIAIRLRRATALWRLNQRGKAAVACFWAMSGIPQDIGRGVRKICRQAATATSSNTPILNVALNLARGGAGLVCALATSVILARALGPQAMGIYGYTLWVAGVMVALCHFGLPTALSKFVAERLGSSDRAGARYVTKKILLVQMAVVAGVTALGVVALIASGVNKEFPWIFAVLLVLPMAMQQALTSALMGSHDYGRLALMGSISAVLQLSLVGLAAWLGGSLTGFLAAIVVSNVIAVGLYWRLVASKLLVTNEPIDQADFDWRTLYRFAGPVAYLVMLDMVVWQRSETYFLKKYSLWQEIGFYSIAYLIVARLSGMLVSVTDTLLPMQSNTLAQSGKAAVGEAQTRVLCWIQIILLPPCIGIALLGRPLIELIYGHAYARVWPVLLVLLASPLAESLTVVSIASLYSLNKQRSLMIPLTFTALLNLSLAYALIPKWGAIGAAFANSAAQSVEGCFLLTFSTLVLSLKGPWFRLLRIYLVAAISFAPAAIALLCGLSVWYIGAITTLCLVFYYIGMLYLGELKVDSAMKIGVLVGVLPE